MANYIAIIIQLYNMVAGHSFIMQFFLPIKRLTNQRKIYDVGKPVFARDLHVHTTVLTPTGSWCKRLSAKQESTKALRKKHHTRPLNWLN